MRMGHRYAVAAASAALTALVAAPLPALADEAAATGDLTVTRFDDRYADGLFDTTKTSPAGDVDRLNTSLAAQLVDVNGTRHYKSADADGLYRFTDVPVGPATLYLGHPNDPANEVFFDATGATSASEIRRMETTQYFGAQGTLQVMIDEDGEKRLIGMTALGVVAKVTKTDGSIVSGLTSIEFGSGGQWFPGSEYAGLPGGYEAQTTGYRVIRHLPGELGMRITAPEGYRVASVTAATGSAPISYPDIPMTITERDGAYWVDSAAVPLYFFSAAFHVTLEELPDTTRPTTTLVTPTTAGPFSSLSLQVDASDDKGLQRIVANVYKDGVLVKSTQTPANGALSASHVATVVLPDGAYTVRYNAQDLAGNISATRTFDVTIDATKPVATVKSGSSYTVGADGVYDLVSFKLYDAGKIDKVVLNGVVKDLSNNAWSDINFVKPGTFGAVRGENTLVVHDVAGNTQTVTFTLN